MASNQILEELAEDYFNAGDTFKLALCASGYSYDPDNHDGYADITELAALYGYTAGGISLTGITVSRDDSNDYVTITWNTVSIPVSGGDMGPTPGYVIYNDTKTTPTADPIVGWVSFGDKNSACPPSWVMPVSKETRVLVEDFSKTMARVRFFRGSKSFPVWTIRFSSRARAMSPRTSSGARFNSERKCRTSYDNCQSVI